MGNPEDDPTRGFLDQTVPRDDVWDGREPEDGPARPRHVQHPTEPAEPLTAKERRKDTIKRAAWTLGPSAAFVAGAALSDDDDDVQTGFEGGIEGGYDGGGY